MNLSRTFFDEMIQAFDRFFRAAGVDLDDAQLMAWSNGERLTLVAQHAETWLVWEHAGEGPAFSDVLQFKHLAYLELGRYSEVEIEAEPKRLRIATANLAVEIPMTQTAPVRDLDYELERVWGPKTDWREDWSRRLLRHVIPAIGQETMRPHLRAVALTGKLVVATDGHRMHSSDIHVELSPGPKRTAVLSPLVVKVLADVMPSRIVRVGVGERFFHAAGAAGDWHLYSELSSASFPNWESVVPDPPLDFELEVHAPALLSALRYIESYRLPCNLFFKDGTLEIQPVAGSGVWGQASLAYSTVRGKPPASMCFNPRYLIDALGERDESVIEMQGTDADGALTIYSEAMLAVVMPMRR